MTFTNVSPENSLRLRNAVQMHGNLWTPVDWYVVVNDAIRAAFNFDHKDPSALGQQSL